MKQFFDWFNNFYPVWPLSLAVLAFFKPQTILWFDKLWIFWSLAASMLGMRLTLSIDDFKAIARMPGSEALGFVTQYTISRCAVGWWLRCFSSKRGSRLTSSWSRVVPGHGIEHD